MIAKQAVILAAGQGTRLRPLTLKTPKCLLKIGSQRIIDYQLDSLRQNGFNSIIIVTGYKSALIRRHLKTKYAWAKITFINNDQYQLTGPAYSLWLAKANLRSEFLLINSDILCSSSAIKKLLAHDFATVVGASSLLPSKKDVGVLVGSNMRVTKIGKKLKLQKNYYEFMGMIKVGKTFRKHLFTSLDQLNTTLNRKLLVDAVTTTVNRTNTKIRALDLAAANIFEIDTLRDLKLATGGLTQN